MFVATARPRKEAQLTLETTSLRAILYHRLRWMQPDRRQVHLLEQPPPREAIVLRFAAM